MKERPILFSGAMVRAILDGSKTQTRRIMKVQPPENFTKGDVAAITNGERWAISNSGFSGGEKGAWPPDPEPGLLCPYGQIGDRLWVRETWGNVAHHIDDNGDLRKWNPDRPATKVNELKFGGGYYSGHIIYRADGEFEWCNDYGEQNSCWHPSIHMPRAASRIMLEITNIRVERLKDISEEDAKAEGMKFTDYGRDCFHNGSISDVGDCPGADSTHPQRNGWSWKETTHQDQCLGSARFAFANLWESINGIYSWDLNPWVWVIEFKRV